ncbi:hypothetical protein PBY51_017192 [Eleginops maclovinus]|nr:hypothetical protein PBY51_017192 [Eleginops maclovinus]
MTPSPRAPPAAERSQGERRQLEGGDGSNTLQSWSNDTARQSLSTLCLCTSHYFSTISVADGRICGEHHSPQK